MKHTVVCRAELSDFHALKVLYQHVARTVGGIARQADEITDEYVQRILSFSLQQGIILVAKLDTTVIGSIHAYRLAPRCFSHVLGELTVAVHPEYQGRGVGRALFSKFLSIVEQEWPSIVRVELMVRESNTKAIALYQSLGFQKEGFLSKRLKNEQGLLEADICMGWINPTSKVNVQ